ncbi:leucine-rich repeat-containing protein 2 isoform X2 [Alosa pseudoharengus]|uniref:leucine-rich repeat-containing protein 2 isoform X2 n=1 Tax=Alosa sapidissima TaxID=34773 RepID=UPI001C08D030|nr:leucine-rich repeat-containing protein 2 isoform X2 [Alosa sapidissima]XP_048098992.1 leucine-rich repeat-containing protein 2 isoform X2 [Alosa alosa]
MKFGMDTAVHGLSLIRSMWESRTEKSQQTESVTMKLENKLDVPVYDLSLIRGMWETRVNKHKKRQRKEQERLAKSALQRVNQQWQYRIACRKMKSSEMTELQHYLERSSLREVTIEPYLEPTEGQTTEPDSTVLEVEEKRFIFELNGDKWTEVPASLFEMTHLREWHISRTKIIKIPEFIAMFQDMRVLDIPKNCIDKLPPEIGKLTKLRELNVSYNRLSDIPPELGDCENLERLELTSNLNLMELPFELSNLKKLVHLDLAENKFIGIPICVLRMSSLQWLDFSNNKLKDLPQDIDRLEELTTLFIHKNKLTYLPMSMANMTTLTTIVTTGDDLVSMPSKLVDNPAMKFIRLFENPVGEETAELENKGDAEQTGPDHSEKEFLQTYINSLKERETAPTYATKVSLSCVL